MFKKKYKKSEWFEGLLYGEHLYEVTGEIFVEHCDGLQSYNILIRNRKHESPWFVKTDVSVEFGQGVLDYLKYKQK